MTEEKNWEPVIRKPSGGGKCDARVYVQPDSGMCLLTEELGYKGKCVVVGRGVDPKTGEKIFASCDPKRRSQFCPLNEKKVKSPEVEEKKAA